MSSVRANGSRSAGLRMKRWVESSKQAVYPQTEDAMKKPSQYRKKKWEMEWVVFIHNVGHVLVRIVDGKQVSP